ncbi:sel1 repeat family protein [Porticoccaceae bacterium]|nr:sel1 repeat family protein [Porticoccaceae bacterium]MDA8682277.1 sel1 repeat family protein [Porticoccaceae bacterium]MDA8788895.1 sel1 repeat family protein [Porticoccaceae bacterium]
MKHCLLSFLIASSFSHSNESMIYDSSFAYGTNNGVDIKELLDRANSGDASAQNIVATSYATGERLPENEREAVLWFQKAAVQGHADAQFSLGYVHSVGFGTSKNLVSALAWMSIAKARGSDDAKERLPQLKRTMTQEQISAAQELAVKCFNSDFKDCEL